MSFRPSDLLGVPDEMIGAEFFSWLGLAIVLWRSDPCLANEFADLSNFLDYAFAETESLIRSADMEDLRR